MAFSSISYRLKQVKEKLTDATPLREPTKEEVFLPVALDMFADDG
jgi:hypothetical protein